MRKLILILMLIVFASSVYAVKPTAQSFEVFGSGIEIKFPELQTIAKGTDVELTFHLFNSSDGMPISSGAICYFHLYNATGHHAYTTQTSTTAHTFDYEIPLSGNNFTTIGRCNYIIQCNTSSIGGFVADSIEVTQNGLEPLDRNYVLLGLVIGTGLIMFFLLWFTINLEKEHTLLKLLNILLCATYIVFIPLAFILQDVVIQAYYKVTLAYVVTFWLYVLCYFIYRVLLHWGIMVIPSGKNEKG